MPECIPVCWGALRWKLRTYPPPQAFSRPHHFFRAKEPQIGYTSLRRKSPRVVIISLRGKFQKLRVHVVGWSLGHWHRAEHVWRSARIVGTRKALLRAEAICAGGSGVSGSAGGGANECGGAAVAGGIGGNREAGGYRRWVAGAGGGIGAGECGNWGAPWKRAAGGRGRGGGGRGFSAGDWASWGFSGGA